MAEEERFDVIVVGGGLSGITAAHVLASAGYAVVLIERGTYCGAKNVTGGRLYAHSLERILPGFLKEAPVERKICKERFSRMQNGTFSTLQYDAGGEPAPTGVSYSILRSRFDQWFAQKAEDAGVFLVTGIKVDDLIHRDGKVCGLVAGGEEMESDLVILADGINSLLAQKLNMWEELPAAAVSVGAKEILECAPARIEQLLDLAPGEGLAWLFRGCASINGLADGFLYTNRDSLSVGISLPVERMRGSEVSVPQMLEEFKRHPAVAPLLEGTQLLEYSAHLLPEAGGPMRPKLYSDGVLVVGDAAALCTDVGYSIRGMDLAVESGRLAAETAVAALKAGDCSAELLGAYQKALEGSFIASCLSEADRTEEAVRGAAEIASPGAPMDWPKAPQPRVEDKLGKNKFHTDEHHSHITPDKEYSDLAELEAVVRACPAALYKLEEDGGLTFDYLGCLECGTCRVLSGGKVIKAWDYPGSSLGVEYRFG